MASQLIWGAIFGDFYSCPSIALQKEGSEIENKLC